MAFQSGSFTLYHILKRTNNEEMSVIDNGTYFIHHIEPQSVLKECINTGSTINTKAQNK